MREETPLHQRNWLKATASLLFFLVLAAGGAGRAATAAPTFTLSPSTGVLALTQNLGSTVGINVNPAGGFNGTVNFSVSGVPAEVSSAFVPVSSKTATTLVFFAGSNAPIGSFNIRVIGISGGISASTTFTLKIAPQPVFTLSAAAASLSVARGKSGSDAVTVNRLNGFSAGVTFTISGLPAGVSGTFAPPSSTTGTTLTLAANAAAPVGSYKVTITGTTPATAVSNAYSSSTDLTLQVTASTGPSPGFTLTPAASTLNLAQNFGGTDNITVTPLGGFKGTVSLSASGFPSGVSHAFAGDLLVVFPPPGTPVGTYLITITGNSGSLSATTTIALVIAPGAGFALTPASSSVSVVQGKGGTDAITLVPSNGFTGTVAFTVAGLPAGASATFTPASSATGTTLAVSTSATTPTGNFPITITGTSAPGNNTQGVTGTAVVNLVVVSAAAAPTVTLTATPAAIVAGGSSQLAWSSTNATSCAASGGWTGAEATSGTLTVSPAATTTYSLACTGPGGTTATPASATVTVSAAGPTATITVSPSTIASGGSSTILWSSTNAASCTPTPSFLFNSPTLATSGTQVTTQSNTASTFPFVIAVSITCTNAAGASATSTANLTVDPVGAPLLSLTATPATIVASSTSLLNWSDSDTTGVCTASGGWSGTQPASGSLSVAPTTTTTYALNCVGTTGVQTQNSFTVAVTPEPAAAVTAALAPPAVNLGTPATLTWSSLYATACTASGSWTGTQPTSGSLAVSPAGTGVYPYTLSCTGPGGPGSATTTLTVYGAGLPIAAVSPATLNFPFQREGSASTALTVTLTNIGAGTLTGSVVAITGDFSETDTCTGAAVGPKSTCVISVTFSPTNSGTRTGTLTVSGGNAANGSVAVSLSGLGAPPVAAVPLPFISVGLPIYASSAAYPASYANDTSYDTEWQSAVTPTAAAPVTLTLDLSSVSTTLTPNIWAVWYNDDTNSYDHVANGNVGYNNVGAYTLAVNAAPGGTAPPTSGWVNVAGLSGNTLHSFSNLFPFTGYNWIQYTFTASDGSTLNENIGLNLDVYGVANTVTDGWFFCGDSLTADAMGHRSILAEDENNPPNQITIAATSFGQQVNALVGNATPLQENGGVPNFSSANMVTYLPEWLPEIPSKYVTLNLGTNDALGGVAPAAFYANMQTLVQEVIAAGKIPVVPTIPYAVNATIQANLPGLNAEIQALYAAYPSIVPGPDLYTYFLNNPQLISSDQVHPNAQGLAAYRTLWAQFAATHIYATPAVAGTLGAKAVASGSSH